MTQQGGLERRGEKPTPFQQVIDTAELVFRLILGCVAYCAVRRKKRVCFIAKPNPQMRKFRNIAKFFVRHAKRRPLNHKAGLAGAAGWSASPLGRPLPNI
jgi:hypothetical protein